jgi:hypothetical protein
MKHDAGVSAKSFMQPSYSVSRKGGKSLLIVKEIVEI